MNSRLMLAFVAGVGAALLVSRYTDEGRRLFGGGNRFFTGL